MKHAKNEIDSLTSIKSVDIVKTFSKNLFYEIILKKNQEHART